MLRGQRSFCFLHYTVTQRTKTVILLLPGYPIIFYGYPTALITSITEKAFRGLSKKKKAATQDGKHKMKVTVIPYMHKIFTWPQEDW